MTDVSLADCNISVAPASPLNSYALLCPHKNFLRVQEQSWNEDEPAAQVSSVRRVKDSVYHQSVTDWTDSVSY